MFFTFEKICVHVEKCNLLDKDGEVDCFINPSNQNLEHTSQVSRSLQAAGGQSYNMECEEVRQCMRQMRTSECLVARTGDRLRTKHVIHAVCPVRNVLEAVSEKEKNKVFDTVFNCLRKAEENRFSSLALTFLLTGLGNFSIDVCGLQYALAVVEFSRQRKNTFAVAKIFFVDQNEEKVQDVTKVFEDILPGSVMQLLEVPIECSDDYCKNNAQKAGQRNQNEVDTEESRDVGIGAGQDCVHGATLLRQGGLEAKETFREEHGQVVGRRSLELSTSDEARDFFKVPSDNNLIYIRIEPKLVHRPNRTDSGRFSLNLGKKNTVIIRKEDIRGAETVAVVCPINCDAPFGGFLAVAIKCKYERNNIRSVIDRKIMVKKKIATLETMAGNGETKYVLHVPVKVWRARDDEETVKTGVETSVRMIFNKLAKSVHRKRNITSVAIPLLGIDNVENPALVDYCCEAQARTVCEILSKRDIPNLQTVHLLNRCGIITSKLIAWANISWASNI